MAKSKGKKQLIATSSKAPEKLSFEELCKRIADWQTKKAEDRKSGASDTVCNHLKMFCTHFNALDDVIPMLNDFKAVESYLSGKKGRGGGALAINSLKSYYTSLKLGAEVAGANKDAIDFYTKKMNEYAGVSNEAVKENAIPEKFTEEGMPQWSDIKDIASTFVNNSKHGQNHMIVTLYTLMPPRRLEYRTMIYLDKKPDKEPVVKPPKARGDKDADGNPWNYIYPEGDAYKMVLGDYKTNKQYGLYEVALSKELSKVVKGYLNKQEVKSGSYFIAKPSGNPYADSAFSKRLTGAFAVKYEKHPLTVDDLRHIYINHLDLNQLSIREKEDIARAMGHSLQKQAEYKQVKTRSKRTSQSVSGDNEASTSKSTSGMPTEGLPPARSESIRRATPEQEEEAESVQAESVPRTQVVISQTPSKEDLIKTMIQYYKLKVKLMEQKLKMFDSI